MALTSSLLFLLHSQETLLAGDRVFVGNQPDELSLVGSLCQGDEVCLLGLGYGGGVRPLLASHPRASLTAVDSDAEMVGTCRSFYSRYFPDVRFQTKVQRALPFLLENRGRFDAVCVDIYDTSGYPPCLFQDVFWEIVQESLTDGAPTVLVNAWGLPEHLGPLDGFSTQKALASLLRRHWPLVYAFPYRRNTTFVAARTPRIAAVRELSSQRMSDSPLFKLSASLIDRAILFQTQIRAEMQELFPVPDAFPDPIDSPPTGRDDINAEMANRWPDFAMRLCNACAHLGLHMEPHTVAARLLRDPSIGGHVLAHLVATKSRLAEFLPIAAAAISIDRLDSSAAWVGRWICDNFDDLRKTNPVWLHRTALPQALALAANPLIPQPSWAPALAEIVLAQRLDSAHDCSEFVPKAQFNAPIE